MANVPEVYICGPESFENAVLDGLGEAGVERTREIRVYQSEQLYVGKADEREQLQWKYE